MRHRGGEALVCLLGRPPSQRERDPELTEGIRTIAPESSSRERGRESLEVALETVRELGLRKVVDDAAAELESLAREYRMEVEQLAEGSFGRRELGEPPRAALLRSLAAPDLLDLIPAEGEDQLAEVLGDVARKWHRQVVVQA